MKVIDFRFRPNTPDVVAGMMQHKVFGPMFEFFDYANRANPQPLDDIIKNLRRLGVHKTVVTSRDIETTYGVGSGNDGVLTLMKSCPDLFIGFAGIDPHKGMAGLREMERMVKECGMKGASTDPYLARIPADHAKYYPFYAKCCELDIPVVITTGPATLMPGAVMDDAHPRFIDRVATDFPELKIIISHGCYPYVAEAIMVVQRHRHVYIELSEYEESPFAEGYIQAANSMIREKMLFASASPFLEIETQLNVYKRLPFAQGVLEDVLYNNGARLLGL